MRVNHSSRIYIVREQIGRLKYPDYPRVIRAITTTICNFGTIQHYQLTAAPYQTIHPNTITIHIASRDAVRTERLCYGPKTPNA